MHFFDDRGVSESLGYILVFAIVLTGIAGIVFFGATMLNDAKDRNNFQNVEQGMTVVHSDLKRVAMEKAPVKTSKLHVEGGTLGTNFTSAAIHVQFPGCDYNNKTGSITYYSSSGMKTLSIENGGLWESYGDSINERNIAPPRIFPSPANNALVINVIRLKGEDSSFAGSGTANLIMEYVGNNVYNYTAAVPSDVIITLDTTSPGAWYRYIDDAIKGSLCGFTVSQLPCADNQMKMKITGVSQVIISEHTINVRPFVRTS